MTDAEDRRLAVLDRFEGDQAVLLIEVGGEIVDEWVLPSKDLPEAGRQQDAIFAVHAEASQRADALEFLPEKTADRAQTAQDRFDRLSERLGGGEDS